MDPLSWTGKIAFLDPILFIALGLLAISVLVWILLSAVLPEQRVINTGNGSTGLSTEPRALASWAVKAALWATTALLVCYLVLGIIMGTGAGIIGAMAQRFLPVWIALVLLFTLSIRYKRRLGLYGKLFDSPIGMIGFALVMFWVFTGFFGAFDLIVTHDPLAQLSGLKNKVPGTPLRSPNEGDFQWYLLGGDNLARDVFSRMVKGAWEVVKIAPLATLFAFMVGITLGLPAGYFDGPPLRFGTLAFWIVFAVLFLVILCATVFVGITTGLIVAGASIVLVLIMIYTSLDTSLSFLANLILAFPVILLFYLLVTPEIVLTGLPQYMAIVLFAFPLIFFYVLINARYRTQPAQNRLYLGVVLLPMLALYLMVVNAPGSKVDILPAVLDRINIPGGILVVFVSVVFVNSPTVFRIVRGLAMDIKTRDYVAAAQTRGERPWYIMLWEVLPNARGPLIVDFCLRIGYTTILLGTLGFFGLGLPPESPDWGSTINEGRKLLAIYLHPALPPAIALLSMVLGLNLLADGLREESLKD
jgi:peptide/nickel transport system permease protein